MTARLPTIDAAAREVEAIVSKSGTSFYHGMRILKPERRLAMWAVYAFCRVVDDIADEPAKLETKLEQLEAWRQRIGQLYLGNPTDAITMVLLDPVADYKLRQEDFLAIIDGMESDALQPIVAPSWDELDLYCDRVASAVGRLSIRIFGDSSPRADDVAWSLGRALQFTNILRDLAEDAARGRMYLPGGWLRDEGIPTTVPLQMLKHPALPTVCDRVAKQAHRYFAAAEAAMDSCDDKAMRPARLMGANYSGILKRLEQRGWKKLDQAVSLPKYLKLWFVLRYGIL